MKRIAMLAAVSVMALLLGACGEHAGQKPEAAGQEQATEHAAAAQPAEEPAHPEAVVEGHQPTAEEGAGASAQE